MKLKTKNNCSLFLTAGYPGLRSAIDLLPEMEAAGVDLVELGIPFSDPLADGSVIQAASNRALKNGMNLNVLFAQMKEIRERSQISIVLMGYFNPIFKYGVERFLENCQLNQIEAVIIPDLPIEVYESEYPSLFEAYHVSPVFLITPETPVERIRKIAQHSKPFIYLVSSSSITGGLDNFTDDQIEGFRKISELQLSVPVLVGFGIHNASTYQTVCNYFQGAIIGSAFLRSLERGESPGDFLAKLTAINPHKS